MTRWSHEADDASRNGAGDETTRRYVKGDGQADYLVSGSRDPWAQLPADAAVAARFKHERYEGLFDRRRGTPSPKRVPLETVARVLRLYQEQYFDFNVQHFHEKLGAEHGILSYTWVEAALQGGGTGEGAEAPREAS